MSSTAVIPSLSRLALALMAGASLLTACAPVPVLPPPADTLSAAQLGLSMSLIIVATTKKRHVR